MLYDDFTGGDPTVNVEENPLSFGDSAWPGKDLACFWDGSYLDPDAVWGGSSQWEDHCPALQWSWERFLWAQCYAGVHAWPDGIKVDVFAPPTTNCEQTAVESVLGSLGCVGLDCDSGGGGGGSDDDGTRLGTGR